MTRRQDLQHHRHSLSEIRNILNAMKTLAYMETRKLSAFCDSQHKVVEGIKDVAADFLYFYPDAQPEEMKATPVYVVVGTERGFCGDVNQALLRHIESSSTIPSIADADLIIVGRKLHNIVGAEIAISVKIDGPSVVEEIPAVLEHIVQAVTDLQAQRPMLSVYGVYHGRESRIITEKLLPPFQPNRQSPRFSSPPILNLPPKAFLLGMTEQYIFSALHELLYSSLLEENHRRVVHLEGAVKHLDHLSEKLTQQFNVLRREEIIEEIEVILLNSGGLGDSKYPK